MKINRFKTTLLLLLIFTTSAFAQYNFNKFKSGAEKDIANKNYTEAIKKLNICIQVEPGNLEVYFYRGLCKYSLYDDIGAEQDYTTALSGFSDIFYECYHNRSLVRYRMGNYQGAISDITMVIDNNPNNPKLYVERAFDLLANNDFNGAISDCKKALSLKWFGADVYLCKAVAEDALADYDNALSDYDEAIRINSKNAELYVRRGMTKFKMDSIHDAIDDYNSALKIDSANTFAYYNRAEAEAKLGNNKKALADYNTVLNYEPRNAYAYFNRGVLFSNMKKYKQAIEDFDKVLILNPENIQAYFNRANLRQNINDFAGAMEDYDKVINLYPYFTEAYYKRAQLKYQMRDASGAKNDIETGKVMSDILHSKNNAQLSRDSALLANLFRLSAEFNNSSNLQNDTVSVSLLRLFYIDKKDSNSGIQFSYNPLLDKLNANKNQSFFFTNQESTTSYTGDTSAIHLINDSLNLINSVTDDPLTDAIQKTNMMLFNEAKELYDKKIVSEANNAIAYFSRGVNTCREIELMGTSNEQYIIANSTSALVLNEKNDKCKSALSDFTMALKLQPKFSFAYYNRAYVKCMLQDFEGALKDYETAIKINSEFAEAYFNKGFLLFYLNNKNQACIDFSKAGELGVLESYSMMRKYCFK